MNEHLSVAQNRWNNGIDLKQRAHVQRRDLGVNTCFVPKGWKI